MRDDAEAGFLDALEFIEKLDPRYRVCRGGRSHNFMDGEQVHGEVHADGSLYTETRCARCDTVKIENTTVRGYYLTRPHYRYPEGYRIKADESGIINRTDLAAAARTVQRFERMGKTVPKVLRQQSGQRK